MNKEHDKLRQFLEPQGYYNFRVINGKLCAMQKMLFTYGVFFDLNWMNYDRRYCYEFESDARDNMEAWDGTGHMAGPWIKVKGPMIDEMNPDIGDGL
jgi:hypothetical protein